MKSLYNKSNHCFQEQQIPLPEQRDYIGNDKGYAEAYHAYAHQQPTRTIACRPGDVWEEGKIYEEGKNYFLTSLTDEDDLFTESFEVCAMAPLAPATQEELWRDLIDTVTNGFDDENLTDKLTAKYQLSLKSEQPENCFQSKVYQWALACFGPEIARDIKERNHRFLEESLELVQAKGCTKAEALMLVDYVFGRPAGEVNQEIGGVMVTLAALCSAGGYNLKNAADIELARINDKIDKIREKQKNKPRNSPLPSNEQPEAVGFAEWMAKNHVVCGERSNGSPGFLYKEKSITADELVNEYQLFKQKKAP